MKEAIYHSNITGIIIVSILPVGDRVSIDSGFWGKTVMTKEQTQKYLIGSDYELIGYV